MKSSTCRYSLRLKICLVFASILLEVAPARAISSLTVIADNSVSLTLSELAREYAREENVSVTTAFVEQSEQALQIYDGAAGDVLITQDTRWIENLQMQGLIDIYSKMEFARGRIALVGPDSSTLELKLSRNFISAPLVYAMNFEPLLYLGSPEYLPEGRIARDALRNLGALYVLEPYTLYSKSKEEMMTLVSEYGAYAVFYYGEARAIPKSRIIDIFPETSHTPIVYYAVVLAGNNMEQAREFVKFLASQDARNIILKSGMLAGVRAPALPASSVPAVQSPANR